MSNITIKKTIIPGLIIILLLSSCNFAFGFQAEKTNDNQITAYSDIKYINLELDFSWPEIIPYEDYYIIHVSETNVNSLQYILTDPGRPILPFNLSNFKLPFGTKIVDVEIEHSEPEIIELPGKIAFSKASFDNLEYPTRINVMDLEVYENSEPYPEDWVSYHAGGGLSYGERTTFLGVRIYPVRYKPADDELLFIQSIAVNVSYLEPTQPPFEEKDVYDLLIISPLKFKPFLQKLVRHKNKHNVKTTIKSTQEIFSKINNHDNQGRIKLFIKDAIENWGIKYVLLVGGKNRQRYSWNLPARYSHVSPWWASDSGETKILSDLYYADIYDGEGKFSSWNSNGNLIYAEFNETYKEEIDNYPDIYLGRLPCRDIIEVKIMVNKIINYEKKKCDESWFKNLILVAGDSYNDTHHFNEGELISELAIEQMPGFTPIKVFASDQDINRETVNNAMNAGAGFAYFCGHGSPISWSTHFPPNASEWTTGYKVKDMMFLKNKEKLPITVVGGCSNAKFQISITEQVIKGVKNKGILPYFAKRFWSDIYYSNCWSWRLTSKIGGGAIATISNTGLGTHGEADVDNNSVADYLEVLDGWLELRFLELYGEENKDILGQNHGEALTGYLNRFYHDKAAEDVKMVHQWELFGDPSLKIGGYE